MCILLAISVIFVADDQDRKQGAMSKRGQKTTSNEGSPMAKAKPCLVARDPRSEENCPQSFGSLVNPAGKSMREDQHQTHSDEGKHSNSNSTRRILASTPELRNMEYTNYQCMSQIFQFQQGRLGMSSSDAAFSMQAYKTNVLIWWMFMSSSMKAAIHLGPNYLANSEIYKNTKFEEIESSSNIVQKLVMAYSSPSWARAVFSHDQVGKGKSMCLCWFRSMCWADEGQSRSNRKMERSSGRTQVVFVLPRSSGHRWRSNWIRVEIFPGFTSWQILQEIQRDLARKNIQPKEFKDRIVFLSMFNDIDGKKSDENCTSNAEKVKNYAMKFSQGHWTFLGPESDTRKKDSQQNDTAIQRNWSSCVQEYQCFQSWDLEWRLNKHRTLVPNNSFCKSAQYFRSSGGLVSTISAWQRKKRDNPHSLWTTRCWQVYHRKRYKSWYLHRQKHVEAGCEKTFWASKRWQVEYRSHNHVKKLTSNIVWQPGNSTKCDLVETTDGEKSLFFVGNTHILDLFRNPKSWQLFPKVQSLDQFWKFKMWKLLMDLGSKMRFRQLSILRTHLTLWYPEKQSALWMKFMITKKSSGPVTNCSQLKGNPTAARKLVLSIASRKLGKPSHQFYWWFFIQENGHSQKWTKMDYDGG